MSKSIFVSHSHEDNIWTEDFYNTLSSYDVNIWMDFKGIEPGDIWIDEIAMQIESCDIFLLILTPSSLVSKWVKREIQLAMVYDKCIITVLVQPVTLPGFLQIYHMLDATQLTINEIAIQLGNILDTRKLNVSEEVIVQIDQILQLLGNIDKKAKIQGEMINADFHGSTDSQSYDILFLHELRSPLTSILVSSQISIRRLERLKLLLLKKSNPS